MKVVVCIKQVPYVDQLKFDTKAGRLIREGVETEINPFDKRALTQAIKLKNDLGAEAMVLTMGPPQADSALREALAMGIGRAVHLLGREFAGADTLATARTLALALRRLGFDLVLCGKYSTDSETAQVPPMLAEFLDVPQVTGLTHLDLQAGGKFIATRETDDGSDTLKGSLPAVMSASEHLIKPIKVTPKDLNGVQSLPIEVLSARDLAQDLSQFGIAGSPTWVEAIYSTEPKRKRIIRTAAGDVEAAVQETILDLMAEGLFGEWKGDYKQVITPHTPRSRPEKSIWTVAEVIEGELRHVTFELLGSSTELADQIDGEVGVILIGADVEKHVQVLAEHGADKVYVAESPDLVNYLTEPFTEVICRAIEQYRPFAVLIPSTANGRDYAPRAAARLGLGLTGDCVGLDIDAEGRLVQLKPAFGGNIIAPILTRTTPAMATVRPGMMQKAEAVPGRVSQVVSLEPPQSPGRLTLLSAELDTREGVTLDDSDIIIGVGMGIGGPENLPLVRELAGVLGAGIGGTRRAVDAGWLARQVQVGLTGRSISPSLYIAVGIRGAFNHTVGIQRAGKILAVNNNPDADIFKQCDYGIVGDWQAIIRAMTVALQNKKKQLA